MMQNTGSSRNHNSSGSNRKYIPFGTYERKRNFKLHGAIALVIAMFLFGFGHYWINIRLPAWRTSSDPLVNTHCGEDGNVFGHVVGYLDGVAAYSNCNDFVASRAFAYFRPSGEHCATIEADGRVTRTSIGERLLQRWKHFHGKKQRAGAADHHKDPGLAEEKDVPVGITAAEPSDDEYICGVQTGMLWQCVEFARRYWFVTQRCLFGSVEGAEDIFKLKSAEVLSDDVDGGKKVVGYRHLESNPNGGGVMPQKGDALIWRRQTDMPYGHVGVIASVDPIKDEKTRHNHHEEPNDHFVDFDVVRSEIVESFAKAALLKKADPSVKSQPPLKRATAEADEEAQIASLHSETAELLKKAVPIAFVGVADQNYHSKSWGGKSHHRHHILLKSEAHVGSTRYHLVDPEGYSVLGWVRLGDAMEEGAGGHQ